MDKGSVADGVRPSTPEHVWMEASVSTGGIRIWCCEQCLTVSWCTDAANNFHEVGACQSGPARQRPGRPLQVLGQHQDRLEAILRRIGGATPGPWSLSRGEVRAAGGKLVAHPRKCDGPLVASARQDLPWLLSLLYQLDGLVHRLARRPEAFARAYYEAFAEVAPCHASSVAQDAMDGLSEEDQAALREQAAELAHVPSHPWEDVPKAHRQLLTDVAREAFCRLAGAGGAS